MKNRLSFLVYLLLASVMMTGCSFIEGIFKAGVWSGVLLVVLILAVIIFIFRKAGRR